MRSARQVVGLPLVLLLILLVPTGRLWAQNDAPPPPPPPPAEALDPASAPASSTAHAAHHAAAAADEPPPSSTHAPHAVQTPARVSVPAEAPASDDLAAASKASVAEVFGLDFMQRALLAGLLVSGVCAYLGVYVVLRRIVFVGVALAEMSSAGVALALLSGFSPMLGSVLLMLAGVALVSVRWGGRRVRQDAFIGIGYVAASALSILLIAKSAQGEGHLLDLLFGNILTVTAGDVRATLVALGIVLLIHALFFKELLFVSFDPDTAAASGYQARLWEAVLYITIGLTIAFSIHAAGVLLAFAMLVIPAVTALLLTRRMNTALIVSVLLGLIPVPVGLYLSFVWDLPSAATIVAVSFVALVVLGGFARLRNAT